MTTLIGIYLTLLSLFIVWKTGRDALQGTCPLFSTRNFFVLGLLLFQSVSGAFTMFTGESENYADVANPEFTGIVFSVVLTLFVILFYAFYSRANWIERLAERRSCVRDSGLLGLVVTGCALTGIGVVLRFAGESIPYVAVILPQISAGCLCGGVALVAMAWARSRFNVFVALILLAAGAGASAVLLVGAFGRREIIGLLFAVVWALYYEKWRYMPVARFLPRAVVASVLMSVVLLLFSSSREGGARVDRSLGRQIERMLTIDPRTVQETVMSSLTGQFAGGISMWIYEARADHGGYYPLHSLFYFVTHPVPRDWWQGKPEGLGLSIVSEAGVRGVAREHSWGPGMVGHLVHDIVFVSLPLYAFILGLAFRYMDARTVLSARDPVSIVLFGSALGQVFGMPRGDLGLFAFHMLSAFGGVWLFGGLIARFTLRVDREATAELRSGEAAEDGWDDGEAADGMTDGADGEFAQALAEDAHAGRR
ncbi:MAG: hypothetical protein RL325_1794 [Planctomycetota bacterium]